MADIGRPKAENPKNINVKIRFDKESHDRLLQYCTDQKITQTEAIRMALNEFLNKEQRTAH